MTLAIALNNAFAAVNAHRAKNPETHNFPCGFAWVTFKTRKNSKVGKELAALGHRWSDYHKSYHISVSTRTQDMDYNTECCNVFVNAMRAAGYEGFNVESRID